MAKLVDIRPGEVVRIGADTLVTLEHKSGQRARLRIDTPQSIAHLKPAELTTTSPAATTPAPPKLFTKA